MGNAGVRAPAALLPIIQKEASANGLDPYFLESVCLQENARLYPNNDPGTIAPWIYADTDHNYAHGIMAMHIPAAQDVGFTGPYLVDGDGKQYSPALATPEASIHYGAAYLAKRGTVTKPPCASGDMSCLAAVFVQGSPTRTPDGSWVRQNYVDGVRGWYEELTGRTLPDERKPSGPIQLPGDPGPPPPDNPPGTQVTCLGFDIETERIIPAPLPSQPYFAFFSVSLVGFGDIAGSQDTGAQTVRNGRVLTPPRPQYVTRFEFEEGSNIMNRCWVRVFDPNWDFAQAISGFDPQSGAHARVSFGYVSQQADGLTEFDIFGINLWSPEFSLRLGSYHPEYVGWGVETELVFEGSGMLMHATDQTRQYNGLKIHEIWDKIAERHDLKLCTQPTASLMCEGADLTSAAPAEKQFLQDESDWVFANRLTMEAAAEATRNLDTGELQPDDYQIRIDDSGTGGDGKTVAHAHPPLYTTPPIRQYTYARQQLGAVIEWAPDFNDEALAKLGAVKVDLRGLDVNNKEFIDCQIDLQKIKGAQFVGPPQPIGLGDLSTDAAPIRRIFKTANGSIKDYCVEGLNFFRKAYNFCTGGTLTVLGDPLIRPQRNIMLLVFTFRAVAEGTLVPELSFTSGVYIVQEVRHIIDGGQYLSALRLFKNNRQSPIDVPPPPDESGGVRNAEQLPAQAQFDLQPSQTFFNTYPNNIVR